MNHNKRFGTLFDTVAHSFESICDRYAYERRRELAAPLLKGRVLNAGSATRAIGISSGQGVRSIALDISERMCRVCRNKAGHPALCGDAEVLPFVANSFDSVISMEMIYYLNRPERFFSEAHRILKPGGTLAISSANHSVAPVYHTVRRWIRRLGVRRAYFDDPVGSFVTERDLTMLYVTTGFELLEIRKTVILPFRILRTLDVMLSTTLLRHLGLFLFAVGRKPL